MSVSWKIRASAVLAPLLLFVAGCGVQLSGISSGGFSVSAQSATVSTTGQLHFTATMPDEEPAAVTWSVTSAQSNGSLGAGSIDATGLYTPPNALTTDNLTVQVTAHLQSDPSRATSRTITITPGFLQPLLPENATVTAGATLEVSAQIAEINGGTVHWSLNDGTTGTLTPTTCTSGKRQYTICKALYTAPSTLSSKQSLHVIATVNDTNTQARLHLLLNNDGVNSSALANQSVQNGPVVLGASGSNDTDFDVYKDASGNSYIADCCGGTLGALVEDTQHNQYILSNNHVLAESDQAKIGDTIDQPGLIDDACRPLNQQGSPVRPVGTLRHFVPLASSLTNVDAALAAVTPGAVTSDGSILQLGVPDTAGNASLGSAPPMAGTGEDLNADTLSGLRVVKSGRTTGLTCSAVETVNLAVKVDYYKDCAETQPYYTKTFTGQIGIGGDSFSDSGDSGSLVVDASNAQPIGLFYAGGTDGDGNGLSVANPISDALNELASETGSRLSIVGTSKPHAVSCLDYDKNTETQPALPDLSNKAQAAAKNAALNASAELSHDKGFLGAVAGKSADNPGDPAVVIYIDKTKPSASVPQVIAGVRTSVVLADAASVASGTAPKLPAVSAGIELSASALTSAAGIAKQYAAQLMSDPAIFGVGVSQSHDDPREAALLVLVDMNKMPKAQPATIGGLRVRYLQLHRFHVTRSKYPGAQRPVSSCALAGNR